MSDNGSQQILVAIQKALFSNTGLLVGRFGTIEFEACWAPKITTDIAYLLERNAGIFPSSVESIGKWVAATKEAFQNADILATGWYLPIVKREQFLLQSWKANASQVVLRSLEPYYSSPEVRWTNALEGKVCVVSSFTKTMASQISKGVWPSGPLPSVEWSWVNTGYAPSVALGKADWEDASSWEEAVGNVVENVLATEARIVLIGCGGLGMVIGDILKKHGKICIIMGGAIQVLFGIKGGRWKNHSVISKLWNNDWVYPSAEETPGAALTIENSCYWQTK